MESVLFISSMHVLLFFFSSSTLTETQKGYPPAIEHIGIPKSVIQEKGMSYVLCQILSEK